MCLSGVAGFPGFRPWDFGELGYFFGKRNHFRMSNYKNKNAYE
jgi:hypothetical protein